MLDGYHMDERFREDERTDEQFERAVVRRVAVGFVVLVLLIVGLNCFYAQDAGEVIVLRSWTGNLCGYTEEPGLHAKAPWVGAISYDVRSNLVNLYHDAEYEYKDGAAEGSCVTVNDKGGASADVDVQVVYSLDADAALNLYVNYGTQEHFTSAIVQNDVRAVSREVAGQFETIKMLTNRGEFTKALRDALVAKWEPIGLDVDNVSIQDVRYAESITSKYAEAQAAEIAKAEAQNEQETEKVRAETKKIKAEGEASANRALSESLTPEVLQQRRIEALKSIGEKGNLVVVPEGSTPLVNVGGE